MRAIVVMLLLLVAALNGTSTARAADRCLRLDRGEGPPQALVFARPKVELRDALERGTQDGRGDVVVRPRTCPHAFHVADGKLWVDGWRGTIRSSSTRLDGIVAAADVTDAVRGSDVLRAGGDADLDRLERRLERTHDARIRVRIMLVALLLALALAAPRRALVGGPAAISAALLLSAVGSTDVELWAVLTLLVALFLPWRGLWVFFAAYLVVLVVSPASQSFALFGPHPESGGRFYGLTNELETLLLAPALLLGLGAAPLVLALVAWSRAGADGGGALVFLASYAWRLPRPRPAVALAYAAAAFVLALMLVGVDAATGGSSHVTRTVGEGPGAVWDALTHRWSVSWHGATATTGRAVLDALLLAALAAIALARPRKPILDAFLVGIAVSLVVNDTPQDVLLWGSLQGFALRRAL